MTRSVALVGLGASLGDRAQTLRLAVQALAALSDTELVSRSRVWASAPLGGVSHRTFLNAVVRLHTALPPEVLLARCKAIEVRLGRRPARRWADRVIDLDLLLYGEQIREGTELCLPHPGLLVRGFALRPAQEVGASLRHPHQNVTLGELRCPSGGGLRPVGTLGGPALPGGSGRSTA